MECLYEIYISTFEPPGVSSLVAAHRNPQMWFIPTGRGITCSQSSHSQTIDFSRLLQRWGVTTHRPKQSGLKMVQPLWNTVWRFCKVLSGVTPLSSNSSSEHISKNPEIRVLESCLDIHVHSSIIHNDWRVETTQMLTDECINKMYIHKI